MIDDNVTISEAIDAEARFFESHPTYSGYSDKLGVPYLSKSLNRILVHHIQRCIPTLNKSISEHLQVKERELSIYEADLPAGCDPGPLVLNLLNRFTTHYSDMIEGRFVRESALECLGGSRISFIFHSILTKAINNVDPFEYLTEQDIQTAIKNASALNPSLFVPEQAFEVLIRQQIARLLEPSLQCANLVYEELRRIVL